LQRRFLAAFVGFFAVQLGEFFSASSAFQLFVPL
jgi:hypothetical protein